ncbi:MAG: PilZ domain-containing protein [Candidatus Omnitrophica bacterium]|nr:PilZ domain-containing protein [Candidatus Omnitrophota bacterium]
MQNKIKVKSVGDVRIYEIIGDFTGGFAINGKKAMKQSIRLCRRKNLFLNMECMDRLDSIGAEVIKTQKGMFEKCAFLTHCTDVKDMISSREDNDDFAIMEDQCEVAQFFSKEFAMRSIANKNYIEQRKYVRLYTVLPLNIKCMMKGDAPTELFAVVTNLSEGGLYAEFIRSKEEDCAREMMNPYDLKLLQLEIDLTGQGKLAVAGKLVHGDINVGGIGVEFYDLNLMDQQKISRWIASHLQNHAEEKDDSV